MKRVSGKMLLLTELAILLAFFVFAAVVCANLFASSDKKLTEAELLSSAVIETTSIAETLKATDGDLTKTGTLLRKDTGLPTDEAFATCRSEDEGLAAGDGRTEHFLILYYTEQMEPTDMQNAVYAATVLKTTADIYYAYEITIGEASGENAVKTTGDSGQSSGKPGATSGGKSESIYSLSFKALKTGGDGNGQ